MDDVDWTPKGGDGATAADPTDIEVDDAISTFVKIATATAMEAHETAQTIWESFCDRNGDEYDPYALYVHGGILSTALAVRTYCGDPNPAGPPTGEIDVMTVARSASTGEFVDLEAAELAGTIIGYACNWEFEKINTLMAAKVEASTDSEFLKEMGDVLTQVFIGVSGIGSLKQP